MTTAETQTPGAGARRHTGLMVLAWAWVGLPFAYGVYELIQKLTQLFSH
jgi:hypothetical protein